MIVLVLSIIFSSKQFLLGSFLFIHTAVGVVVCMACVGRQ